ncbi:MAG: hypothetical protein GC154_14650 [bacterium]|nr:hypothetical protein [bacterium]
MKFTCDEIQSRWPEYVYRELTEHEQAEFVRHLERCPACRAEEAKWRGLLARFDGLAAADDSAEAPAELVFRVKRQIRLYEDWTRQNWAAIRNWAASVAASCLIVFFAAWALVDRLQPLAGRALPGAAHESPLYRGIYPGGVMPGGVLSLDAAPRAGDRSIGSATARPSS